ncbi:hypothetical protein SORBI_3008G123801 [Sorghum bicolor]|uniref:Uncharacterized protein n=1 Tax=Sorghum bicolor TaxID=4558 RepID=A0A1Z5R764_SORBI|nr:hypothetical protein SORBI_3008G123801 [Sorghum bicolor]
MTGCAIYKARHESEWLRITCASHVVAEKNNSAMPTLAVSPSPPGFLHASFLIITFNLVSAAEAEEEEQPEPCATRRLLPCSSPARLLTRLALQCRKGHHRIGIYQIELTHILAARLPRSPTTDQLAKTKLALPGLSGPVLIPSSIS